MVWQQVGSDALNSYQLYTTNGTGTMQWEGKVWQTGEVGNPARQGSVTGVPTPTSEGLRCKSVGRGKIGNTARQCSATGQPTSQGLYEAQSLSGTVGTQAV